MHTEYKFDAQYLFDRAEEKSTEARQKLFDLAEEQRRQQPQNPVSFHFEYINFLSDSSPSTRKATARDKTPEENPRVVLFSRLNNSDCKLCYGHHPAIKLTS